jgi:hypothetical protein
MAFPAGIKEKDGLKPALLRILCQFFRENSRYFSLRKSAFRRERKLCGLFEMWYVKTIAASLQRSYPLLSR